MNKQESIFLAALELQGEVEQRQFLEKACDGDARLLAEVESLLRAAGSVGSFLEQPIVNGLTDDDVIGSRPQKRKSPERLSSVAIDDVPKIGNYEIRRRLGEGGMGTVYLARHARLKKDVALKVLRVRPNGNQNLAVARFEQELQALGRLDHPNIVRALDAGELDGIVFLSMELLDGVDLGEATQGGAALTVADACEVARQAACGLQFAHDRGLIHRDVKPANFMLTVDPVRQVCVKVLDLGLAVMDSDQSNERLTDEGVVMGTFLFMSPEQAMNVKSVDHRADIYSLGATFYRLLTGKPPFSGSNYSSPGQVLRALATESAPSLRVVLPGAPKAIVTLVDRMLARDPADRPQDLNEVINSLEPFCQAHRLAELLSQKRAEKLADETVGQARIDLGMKRLFAQQSPMSTNMADPLVDEIGVLCHRVKKFWVDGVLAHVEENEDLLPLCRSMRPDAVVQPWEGVAEMPLSTVDAEGTIEQIFEGADRSLLILGQPGAGKSTTLLQLARELLKSEKRREAVVPVVLHLSTWTDSAQTLAAWIEQELSVKYQIPRSIGREFVSDCRLLLMLDGLDEVRTELQAGCVDAINQFLETQPPPGIVVSSRSEEYSAIGRKLKLTDAILIKPLSGEQIVASLSAGSSKFVPLLTALSENDSMMDLAKTPLMLSVMKFSFVDPSDQTIMGFEALDRSPEQLFGAYVDRMFRSKGKTEQGYSKANAVRWLGWLARRMDERNQSVFLVEDLQPSWFETRQQQLLYASVLSIGLGWVMAVLAFFMWHNVLKMMDFASVTSSASLLWLFLQIPIWLLTISAFNFRFFASPTLVAGRRSGSIWLAACRALFYVGLWLLWPLVLGATGVWGTGWIISNVILGLIIATSVSVQGRGRRIMADIGTVEGLGVSARRSFYGWLWGLLVGYCIYQAYLWLWAYYLLDAPPDWFPYYWKSWEEIYVSISWPLVGGAFGAVLGGLVPKVLRQNTVPNQGMRMSLRNALIAGVFSSGVISVTCFLAIYFWVLLVEDTPDLALLDQLLIAGSATMLTSFLVALTFGGLDFVKHFLTRQILVAAGLIPKELVEFLKYSSRLSFLKRAGGAYIFNHQLLLKYFASGKQSGVDRRSETATLKFNPEGGTGR